MSAEGNRNRARIGLAIILAAWGVGRGIASQGAEPEYPSVPLGARTAPLVLLSRPDVRADMALSAEQTAAAEHTLKSLQAKARELKGKKGQDIVAARRAIDEAQERWIETELTADQRSRLAQIDLQWEGPTALGSRPRVAETIGLTAEQRARVSRAIAEHNSKRAQHQAPADDERVLAQEVLAILTPDQRSRWKTMLGRPFVPQVAQGTQTAPPR